MNQVPITQLTSAKMRSKYFTVKAYPKLSDFKARELNDDHRELPVEAENLPANLVGTMVDLLTRAYLFSYSDTFMTATLGWEAYKLVYHAPDDGLLDNAIKKAFTYHAGQTAIDDLPRDFFEAGEILAGLENVYRSGRVFGEIQPRIDDETIDHVKIMLERADEFFKQYGQPTQINFRVQSPALGLFGDGDYLNAEHLIDFKVSKHTPRGKIDNRLQVVLYYILGKASGRYPEFETVKDFIFFNPRINTVETASIDCISDLLKEQVDAAVTKLDKKSGFQIHG